MTTLVRNFRTELFALKFTKTFYPVQVEQLFSWLVLFILLLPMFFLLSFRKMFLQLCKFTQLFQDELFLEMARFPKMSDTCTEVLEISSTSSSSSFEAPYQLQWCKVKTSSLQNDPPIPMYKSYLVHFNGLLADVKFTYITFLLVVQIQSALHAKI